MAPRRPVDAVALAARAREFARQYVVLVEALLQEGVSEEIAREEGRVTALTLMFEDANEVTGPPCPVCGRPRAKEEVEGA